MGKLIHDIKPNKPIDRQVRMLVPAWKSMAKTIPTEVIVEELANRGVTIEDIFGMYYALEEQAGHRQDEAEGYSETGNHGANAGKPLTIGDAELAGMIPKLPPVPNDRQPF